MTARALHDGEPGAGAQLAAGHPAAAHPAAEDVAAVILAGGRASRLGGIDKTALARCGVTLLAEAVLAASGCARTVVVGAGNRDGGVPVAHRDAARGARMIDETPAHGGPAAALAAGVRELTADITASAPGWILVLAADLPHAREAVRSLLPRRHGILAADHDALIAHDPDGRAQPLLALYRGAALVTALAAVDADRGLPGASLRSVLDAMGSDRIAAADLDARLCADVDTPTDMRAHGLLALDDRIPLDAR